MNFSPSALQVMGLLCLAFLAMGADVAHAPNAVSVDGGRYFGAMAAGRFHGHGRMEWADGSHYEGEFGNGMMSGLGRLVSSTSEVYIGQFKMGLFHGKGRFEDKDGDVYEGDFVRGEFTGNGTHVSKAGVRRTGRFQNWRQHGQGTFTDAEGTVYIGEFSEGVYHGEGSLHYAKGRVDGGTTDRGVWNKDEFTAIDEDRQTQRNVEIALSMQGTLLDTAHRALVPSDPAAINMYLLAIAGDGAETALRREVQFVRDQFDRALGTHGRSIALINSRTTVGTVPMATVTSIRTSLKAISSRMDLDKDILFLYLNSHGSKDHKLMLDQNGMDLRDLSAKELGAMIKENGIRWKVIVVSACYSGGFIDAVKDEHTLVITSARHDRTSFGIGDAHDFTYFGRAFFKEALPASASFQAAYAKAKDLIAQWEAKGDRREQYGPADFLSFPQMRNPPAIDNHLKRWRTQLPASTQAFASN